MGETTVIDYADIDMGQNAPYTDFGSIWSKKWLDFIAFYYGYNSKCSVGQRKEIKGYKRFH